LVAERFLLVSEQSFLKAQDMASRGLCDAGSTFGALFEVRAFCLHHLDYLMSYCRQSDGARDALVSFLEYVVAYEYCSNARCTHSAVDPFCCIWS
jgi:hypothetical protein